MGQRLSSKGKIVQEFVIIDDGMVVVLEGWYAGVKDVTAQAVRELPK